MHGFVVMVLILFTFTSPKENPIYFLKIGVPRVLKYNMLTKLWIIAIYMYQ